MVFPCEAFFAFLVFLSVQGPALIYLLFLGGLVWFGWGMRVYGIGFKRDVYELGGKRDEMDDYGGG